MWSPKESFQNYISNTTFFIKKKKIFWTYTFAVDQFWSFCRLHEFMFSLFLPCFFVSVFLSLVNVLDYIFDRKTGCGSLNWKLFDDDGGGGDDDDYDNNNKNSNNVSDT